MRLTIMILILGVNASHATEAEENYKLAATRLTIAYQCAPILDDNSFYELAKRNSVELIGDVMSKQLFSLVEAQ